MTWETAQSEAADTLADDLEHAADALRRIAGALTPLERGAIVAAITQLDLVAKRQREKARLLLA